MKNKTKINLSWKILFGVVLAGLLSACGGGGGSDGDNNNDTGNPVQSAKSSQAILGPLSGASVQAFRLGDLSSPVETTTAEESDSDLDIAGSFDLILSGIPDDEMILVSVSGGNDIDADDDGVLDASPTVNSGTIHALATAADWRKGGKINILTEMAWRETKPKVEAGDLEGLQDHLKWVAMTFIGEDVNGDDDIDYKDLIDFNPRDRSHRRKLLVTYERFMEKDDRGISLVDLIHSDDGDGLEIRITELFGDSLKLPEVPAMVALQTNVIAVANRQGMTEQDITVSNNGDVLDSETPTTLIATDMDGNTVMLALANNSGDLLAGTADSVEISVKSTAATLVAFATGLPPVQRNADMMGAISSHAKFETLQLQLADAMAVDMNALDHIMDYASIMSLINEIAADVKAAQMANKPAFAATDVTGYSSTRVGQRLAYKITSTESDFYCFWFKCSPWADKESWDWWEGSAIGAEAIYPDNIFDLSVLVSQMIVNPEVAAGYALADAYADLVADSLKLPFLATSQVDAGVLALANPTSANYVFEMYSGDKLVDWRITPRNSTIVQKLLSSGAAKRELMIPDDIDDQVDRVRFQRHTWSTDISSRRALVSTLNAIHLITASIQVVSDASVVSKTIQRVTRSKKALNYMSSCLAQLGNTVDYTSGSKGLSVVEEARLFARNNASSIFETFLTSSCMNAVYESVGKFGFVKDLTNQVLKSSVFTSIKTSNPAGWVWMAVGAANQFVPVATSILYTKNESVEFNLGWGRDEGNNFYVNNVSKYLLPTVNFTSSQGAGTQVQFTAQGVVDAENGATSLYIWDFGDGQTDMGSVVSHTYATAGEKKVILTLDDDLGNQTTVSRTIIVSNGRAPVISSKVCGPDRIDPENATRLSFGAKIGDPDGDLATIRWYKSASDDVPTIVTDASFDAEAGVVFQYPDDGIYSYNPAVEAEDAVGNVSKRVECLYSQNVSGGIDINNGLVAYYPFDGDANDASGNGNNGTVEGVVDYVNSNNDTAIRFDDAIDRVAVPQSASLQPSDEITISAWVKYNSEPSNYSENKIVSNSIKSPLPWSGYWLDVIPNDSTVSDSSLIMKPRMHLTTDNGQVSIYGDTALTVGQWHHVAAVYGPNRREIYVDGIKTVNQSVSDAYTTGSGPIRYGNNANLDIASWDSRGSYNGEIDELRIYSRALSPAEISTLAGVTADINKGLIAYYPFDGDANDSSSSRLDGSVFGDLVYDFGIKGQAARFNGSNTYIELFDISSNPGFYDDNSKSISVWFYLDVCDAPQNSGNETGAGIIDIYNALSSIRAHIVGTRAPCELYSWKNNGYELTIDQDINLKRWHHVVINYNKEVSTVSTYLNGELVSTGSMSDFRFSPEAKLVLGKRQYYDDRFLSGMIDELRIYDRPLNESEISILSTQ